MIFTGFTPNLARIGGRHSMRILIAVVLAVALASPSGAKTEAEKAAEKATKEQAKAAEKARRDSVETAKQLAKLAQVEARKPVPESEGPPQVLIQGSTRTEVVDALVARLNGRGWTVTQATDHLVVGEQARQGTAAYVDEAVHKRMAKDRITYSLMGEGGGTRVVGRIETIFSNYIGASRAVDLTMIRGGWDNLANALHQVQAQLAESAASASIDSTATP